MPTAPAAAAWTAQGTTITPAHKGFIYIFALYNKVTFHNIYCSHFMTRESDLQKKFTPSTETLTNRHQQTDLHAMNTFTCCLNMSLLN